MLLAFVSAHARADEPQRQLLATGDLLPGVGRIGESSLGLLAIDASARLLIFGEVSSGGREVFWTSGHTTDLVWSIEDPANTVDPDFYDAGISPSGNIVAIAGPLAHPEAWPSILYQLRPTPLRPLLAPGDLIHDDYRICRLDLQPRVSDDGVIGLTAAVVASGGSCDTDAAQALLRLYDADAEIIAGSVASLPDERRFESVAVVGVADDGAVLFRGSRANGAAGSTSGVYAADTKRVRRVVIDGDADAMGNPVFLGDVLAAGASGEVLFTASAAGQSNASAIYRTDRGQIVRLDDYSAPDGRQFTLQSGALNRHGDAAVTVAWQAECDDCAAVDGVLLYPAGGGVRVIADSAESRGINDRADVALLDDHDQFVARWHDGVTTVVARPEDRAPSGGYLLTGGIPISCLADDGRAGAIVYTTGGGAVLCIDARGTHVLATAADLSARMLSGFSQCAFSDRPGEMTLAGIDAVYRVAAGSIETLLNAFWIQEMVVNRRGTVAVRDWYIRLLRRAIDGSVEEVPFPPPTAVGGASELGIADDDSVIAGAYLPGEFEDTSTIIYSGSAGTRIIANRSDPTLPGAPYDVLSRVRVHGSLAVFTGLDSWQDFLYSVDSGELSKLPPDDLRAQLPAGPIVEDFTAGGGLVYSGSFDPGDGATRVGYFLVHDESVRLVSSYAWPGDRYVSLVGVNDRQNLLLSDGIARQGGGNRDTLQLSGPAPAGECPAALSAPTTPTATPPANQRSDGGCQITASSEPAPGVLVIIALAFRAGRRRSRERMRRPHPIPVEPPST